MRLTIFFLSFLLGRRGYCEIVVSGRKSGRNKILQADVPCVKRNIHCDLAAVRMGTATHCK
jgi:hypothetical protein